MPVFNQTTRNSPIPRGGVVISNKLSMAANGQVTHTATIIHDGAIKRIAQPIRTITQGHLLPSWKFRAGNGR